MNVRFIVDIDTKAICEPLFSYYISKHYLSTCVYHKWSRHSPCFQGAHNLVGERDYTQIVTSSSLKL